jgi:hypothetical protein
MEFELTQLSGALLVAVAAFSYLALRAWRNQALEQSRSLGELPTEFPHGTDRNKLEGSYVVTTISNEPLNRIKASGLGMRGVAEIEYSRAGISIWRTGERALHIPASELIGVDRATAVIDRAVEAGGLSRVTWSTTSTTLDTYLRFASGAAQSQFQEFFSTITPKQNQGENQ